MDRERAAESLIRLVDFVRQLDNPTPAKVSWVLGEARILSEICEGKWRPDDLAALAYRLTSEAAAESPAG